MGLYIMLGSHVRVKSPTRYKQADFFFFLLSRACALPSVRERELRARGRAKANAVAYEKTSSRQRWRDKTGTVYLHITRSYFGAEISRPVGSCYRWRRLRIFTGRNNRVSPTNLQSWRRSGSKESGVRWGKWRCGCNFLHLLFMSQNGG